MELVRSGLTMWLAQEGKTDSLTVLLLLLVYITVGTVKMPECDAQLNVSLIK